MVTSFFRGQPEYVYFLYRDRASFQVQFFLLLIFHLALTSGPVTGIAGERK